MAVEPSDSFATLLRRYRRAAGLTQDELANQAHMSAFTISSLERGIYRPHKTTLALLADALHLSPHDRPLFEASARNSHADIGSQAASVSRSALPQALTRLIGREHDIQAVIQMILHEHCRLVTLTGTAGIGKTRLAISIAAHVQPHFSAGVFFVPLAHLQDWRLIPHSIAQTLGLQEEPAQSLWDLITADLGTKSTLIVLDNLEHLLEGVAFVVDLLLSCPALIILATSRAALRVRGEHRYSVPPLTFAPASPDEECSHAETLFLERAREVQPLFPLTPQNKATIAAICQRLEGIPLAIELAAMRAAAFTPSLILQRLDHRLSLLVAGPRDLPLRQQTMREAVAWSYDLLSPEEQSVFRRMSIFAGGGTLSAAQELCSDDLSHDDVFTIMSALVETNLVRRETAEDPDEPRFAMLEILREYGMEQLTLHGELADTQRRHAECMLKLALMAGPALNGAEQGQWLVRLDREQSNMRAALHWTSEHDLTLGLHIAATIWRYWYMRRYLREGLAWIEFFLSHMQISNDNGEIRSQASYAASTLAAELGTYGRAEHFASISFSVSQELGNVMGMCKILNVQGYLAFRQDHFSQAEKCYRQSLSMSQSIDDPGYRAAALNSLAIIDTMQGRYQEAHARLEEGLLQIRAVGHQQGIAAILLSLSNLCYKQGDYANAATYAEEGMEQANQSGDRNLVASAFYYLGKVAAGQGKHQQAFELLEQSRQIFEEMDDEPVSPAVLRHLGNVTREQREWQQAETYYRASIILAQKAGQTLSIAKGLAEWAQALVLQGQAERAAHYASKATAILAEIDISPQASVSLQLDRTKCAILEDLDETTFQVARDLGISLSLDDLLAAR